MEASPGRVGTRRAQQWGSKATVCPHRQDFRRVEQLIRRGSTTLRGGRELSLEGGRSRTAPRCGHCEALWSRPGDGRHGGERSVIGCGPPREQHPPIHCLVRGVDLQRGVQVCFEHCASDERVKDAHLGLREPWEKTRVSWQESAACAGMRPRTSRALWRKSKLTLALCETGGLQTKGSGSNGVQQGAATSWRTWVDLSLPHPHALGRRTFHTSPAVLTKGN